jgi:hypothetical protein
MEGNFKYWLYDKSKVTPWYFGKPKESSSDDRLRDLGLLAQEPIESTGLISDIRKANEPTFIDAVKDSAGMIKKAIEVPGAALASTAIWVVEWTQQAIEDVKDFRAGTIWEEFANQEEVDRGILGRLLRAWMDKWDELTQRRAERWDALTWFEEGVETFWGWLWVLANVFWETFMSGLKTVATDEQEAAVKETIADAIKSEKGQQGVKALNEGIDAFEAFEDENPRIWSLLRTAGNAWLVWLEVLWVKAWGQTGRLLKEGWEAVVKQADDIAEGIVRTIKESTDLIDKDRLAETLATKSRKLDLSAAEQNLIDAESIALPTLKEIGKKDKRALFGRTIESGKWPFAKQEIVRTPAEVNSIKEVSKLLDSGAMKKGMTPIQKREVIEQSIWEISDTLNSNLRASNISISQKQMDDLFDELSQSVIDNPIIVGNAESSIKKLLPTLKKGLTKDEYFPEDILQIRKDFDKAIRAAKWEWVFDPNLENAFSTAIRDFRQGLNNKVSELVPDAQVKDLLSRQSALFNASKTLEDRFVSQANSFAGRLLSKVQEVTGVPRTEIVELATALGLAGVSIPFAAPLAWVVWAVAIGREWFKMLTRPAIKKKIAQILRKYEYAIKNNPAKAKEITESKEAFENLITKWWNDVDNLNPGVNSVDNASTIGRNIDDTTGFNKAGAAKSAEVNTLKQAIKEAPDTTIGYHWTNKQFDEFLDKMIGKGATAKFWDWVYLSSSPEVAKTYADLMGGLKWGKPRLLEVAIPDNMSIKSYDWPITWLKNASTEAKKAWFKGIKYNAWDDYIKVPWGRSVDTTGHSNYIIFDPSDAKIVKNNVIKELGVVKWLWLMRDLLAGSIVWLSAVQWALEIKMFLDRSKQKEETQTTLTPRG